MSSFTLIAEHYDDLMDGVPYEMWLTYLELLWSKLDQTPTRVLEVCCGTGTMSLELAKKGVSMAGIDLSPQMIEVARRRAGDAGLELDYSCQDAAQFDLPWKFDAAFSFFDSLNYIVDPEACRSAIRKTAEHLNPGGSFIFDLNTAYAFEQRMFDQTDMRPDRNVRYHWVSEYDAKQKICRVDMDFWVGDRAFREQHFQRAHSRDEVTEWMREAGFATVQFFDAYTLNRTRAKSDRIHVVGVLPAS